MQEVYPVPEEAEMIVPASPVYYLKKAALLLRSGSDHVYCGAIYEYQNSFLNYLKLEDMGIYSAYDKQNKSEEKLNELREFGKSLK